MIVLIFSSFLWFSVFGLIYFYFKANLLIYEDKIIVTNGKKTFLVNKKEIFCIEKRKSLNNSMAEVYYYLDLVYESKLPKRFRKISNKKYQSQIENISIVKNICIID